MSKSYPKIPERFTHQIASGSSKTSSSSTSYKYSETAKITSTSTVAAKANNDYKSNQMAFDVNKSRPPINKSSTVTTSKPTLTSKYTPVYPLRPRERIYSTTTNSYTSVNRPRPEPTLTSTKNYNMFNEVLTSIPKQNKNLPPNNNRGVFYSFAENSATPKPSVTVPAMVTAAALSTPVSKPKPADRPIPPPSLLVDRPKKSLFSNIFGSRKRGYALILNHYIYENDFQATREGTQFDVDKLRTVFDLYKIETHVKTDLRLNQIRAEVNVLKYKDFSSYECFIIVILTHGNRNEVLCSADKSYNFIHEIEDPLLTENKTLLDKPKIFVIQACRGSHEMPVIETDSVPIHRNFTVAKRNIFKCNATYEGYVSFRNTKHGTIFIQTFCNQLQMIGKYTTIYNVMMKVIEEVSNHPEVPQVPTVVSSMTNSFCFGKLLK